MSTLVLTPTQMRQGIWQGLITQTGSGVPQIEVAHRNKPVPNVELKETKTEGQWVVQVPIPTDAIADGVQVFLITDALNGAKIGDFTLIAGEALGDDIRVEMELLRAELDMLKRAFRRHCTETA